MKSSEIRKKFLKYFEGKGHKVLPGSSLVPADPTVLLTLAGMLQFKPIFLGQEKPQYGKVTTAQKCVRTIDLERVGKTARHHTFFEMLGNFSFGDYFKKEAIRYAWELLTQEFNLPVAKLAVAVFQKDDEAYDLWRKEMGVPAEKIFRLDADNNFWAVGPTGPCGPCSELYYDQGAAQGCGQPNCQPGCDCDRFLEVWNLVFIQYNRTAQGELIPLKQKGIDTGLGLERLASVLQGVGSNFDTDLFLPLIAQVKQLAAQAEPSQRSLRIIVDHARAVTNLISDGVLPENTGRGYIVRRLIRRAVHHGVLLGIRKPFLSQLSRAVVSQLGEVYPVLGQEEKTIAQVIKTEEENFQATLEQGLQLLQAVIAKHGQDKIIPGETAFKLHDTFGFPAELTSEIAAEAGCRVDEQGFTRAMDQQRERGREAGLSADKKKIFNLDLSRFGETKFEGFEKTSEQTRVKAVFPAVKAVILERSPFYGASGGQVGDTGHLSLNSRELKVVDTLKTPHGVLLHVLEDTPSLKENDKVTAAIDEPKRQATAQHHTATHLLHQALKEILGDHVKQAGSYVGPDKLRFDFTHYAGLSAEEILKIEERVNQQIHDKLRVEVLQKSYREAVKMGAVALFGEKYGAKVRVLKIGNYSLELCGGTHVKSTAELLFFKIISESALGAGIRRIEAVAGQAAKVYITDLSQTLCGQATEQLQRYNQLEKEKEALGGQRFTETGIFEIECAELDRLLKAVDSQDSVNVAKIIEHLLGRVEWLRERVAKVEKEINQLKLKSASSGASDHIQAMEAIKGVKVLIKEFAGLGMQELRAVSDAVHNQTQSSVIVLASAFPGKLVYLVAVTDDLIAQGFSAQQIAKAFALVVEGKGGGTAGKAEGGGRKPGKISEGFEAVRQLLSSWIF